MAVLVAVVSFWFCLEKQSLDDITLLQNVAFVMKDGEVARKATAQDRRCDATRAAKITPR